MGDKTNDSVGPDGQTWQDRAFKEMTRGDGHQKDWVVSQHVKPEVASCGCRLLVYIDDVMPGPHLDSSRCQASTALDQARLAEQAKVQIMKLKKEVAAL